jgi:hypothetical protein
MTRYRFEIDTDNAIRIWDNVTIGEQGAPFMFQPDWPDVTPWASLAQATDWAEVFIASLENPESEFVAGNSHENHPALRPEPEPEIAPE